MDEKDREGMERRAKARIARRKRQRKRQLMIRTGCVVIAVFVVLGILLVNSLMKKKEKEEIALQTESSQLKHVSEQPELDVQLLSVNEYSRPGLTLEKVEGIVVHYTANPGTSAIANRDYFQSLAQSHSTHASCHFIIGLDGEIIQCIPCNEIAYASNERNYDTISIECCIDDESGKFNDATYESLVHLTSWLMGRYSLNSETVIRHYDVTGKACPKYYVEHEKEWDKFKKDLLEYIDENGTPIK